MTATTIPKGRLTPRQAQVLRCIVRYWGEHGVMPTFRDLCGILGISSTNGVTCHLVALVEKDYLRWGPDGKSRSVVVPELVAGAKAVADAYLSELEGKE